MAKKILLPVVPSDTFYDAVVAAGDVVSSEGGLITFLFTTTRPPESVYEADGDGHPSLVDVSEDTTDADGRDLEMWHEKQVEALEEARQLLSERGVNEERIDYVFADSADHESPAQAIADEAAAGAYDLVVLSRGYFTDGVEDSGTPGEIANAVQAIGGDVKLLVT